jgi:Tfp pilus assembly protein PilF
MGESPDLYLPKAREAIHRALALDDTLAPAHASLAKMRMHYDRDWSGAEREFRRAIELNPNYAQAHHWYGEVYLSAMGGWTNPCES